MRRRLILVLFLVASLGGALTLLLWNGETPPAQAGVPAKPVILVAAAQLPVGTLIRVEDVEWRSWTGDAPPPHAIERRPADAPADASAQLADVTGAVLRHGVERGDPILADNIAKPGDRGFLAAVLEPGMRALSIAVNANSGTTGLIYPGDRVDVILAQTFKESDAPAGRRSSGETVAQNLRVLAIDQRSQSARSEPAPVADFRGPRTVTLEVSPRQSEQITVAAELGKLSLTLRSLVTGEEGVEGSGAPVVEKPVWAEDVSSALRANLPKISSEHPAQLLIMRGVKTELANKTN